MVGAYLFETLNSDRQCVFEYRYQTNYVTRESVLDQLKVPRVTSVGPVIQLEFMELRFIVGFHLVLETIGVIKHSSSNTKTFFDHQITDVYFCILYLHMLIIRFVARRTYMISVIFCANCSYTL